MRGKRKPEVIIVVVIVHVANVDRSAGGHISHLAEGGKVVLHVFIVERVHTGKYRLFSEDATDHSVAMGYENLPWISAAKSNVR